MAAPVRVSDLPRGAVARLERAELDADTRRVLRALGLAETSRFRLCTDHEPYILQVRATRIGISGIVARGLYASVEPRGAA